MFVYDTYHGAEMEDKKHTHDKHLMIFVFLAEMRIAYR